ncbi:Uncharacterised protein [Rikenella microfusus]|uniref:Uncharacterized protein n=1 Tax=Rikenella microfusus TaxID=28139 RepID=A0A379MQV7_9BACT|nr:Uncharacterised protein [Rikenella microfusus]
MLRGGEGEAREAEGARRRGGRRRGDEGAQKGAEGRAIWAVNFRGNGSPGAGRQSRRKTGRREAGECLAMCMKNN